MHIVRLATPLISDRTVTFRWTVEPATPLYRENSFSLRFPESVDLDRVSAWMWWRIALSCLHTHWAWIRPCRVILPIRLAPGERETWLRLIDAEVWSLEADRGGDLSRQVEIVEAGPLVPSPQPTSGHAVVAAFSGGRDSLTQAALLQEIGEPPVLVTTTSPREGSLEHTTPRRRHVMSEIVRRRGLELVEVVSDFRGVWNNGHLAAQYGRSVNEVTDTFLFFATALAVAAARGAGSVFLASEAEVQETVRAGGLILQHRHFMYSAVTQRALAAIIAPAGIRYSGLTYPLLQFQVQRLLTRRFADLRDLQYSCWELSADQSACSRCRECFTIALNLLADSVSPEEIGIDLATLFVAQRQWRPGGTPERPRGRVGGVAGRYGDAQAVRALRRLDTSWVTTQLELSDNPQEAIAAFNELRTMAFAAAAPEPEPGYRAGYLTLVDERVRHGLERILDEQFARAEPPSYAGLLERTATLANWIVAPVQEPHRFERPAPDLERKPSIPRPPAPPATPADLASIADCIPGREPVLLAPPGGHILRVAESLLDGNEKRYVTECIDVNWVSSTGTFVPRLEAAFAAAAGCDFGIATSSGTTALHLMLVAAGIGAGDEVIVPAFTMIATANTVSLTGATPVFVDADPATWNLDPVRVAESISPRTRAILAVHTYGLPVDIDVLASLAHGNGVLLLEDAAEAHGATYRGRPVGSLGAAAAFSFYGNKIVTTGEGGMVTTNDPAIAAAARELRDHGFSHERHFWHRHRAFNYRLSNLQAAVGLAQVERLDALVTARRRNAMLYRQHLADIAGLMLPPERDGMVSACWMFGVLVSDEFGCSRDELRNRLAAEGIETRTFFVPLHLQPAYRADNAGRRHPIAERLGRTGLYLPSGPRLTESDIARVAEAVRRAADVADAHVAARSPNSV